MTSVIFKILPLAFWRASVGTGEVAWLPVDKADGFLHFSTRAQLPKTLENHFSGQTGLLVLEIPTANLPEQIATQLKWEKNNPQGDAYPHLYTDLPTEYVTKVFKVVSNTDGSHSVPEIF